MAEKTLRDFVQQYGTYRLAALAYWRGQMSREDERQFEEITNTPLLTQYGIVLATYEKHYVH